MDIELESLRIETQPGDAMAATLLSPQHGLPGVLFVHGWGGSQQQDLSRARDVAALGCVCLTFDLRGHSANGDRKETVTRGENLDDLCAAYDWLAGRSRVDAAAIAVVGVSYGGYLASLLSVLRPVRWLALRTPALYLDRDWDLPKARLHDDPELIAYRHRRMEAIDNRALAACGRFGGDVLLVEAERDAIIPHAVIENYGTAFSNARSMTKRLIAGADHAFSDKAAQHQYNEVLVTWLTEMIGGTRSALAAQKIHADRQRRRDSVQAQSGTLSKR